MLGPYGLGNRNESNLKALSSINWRASLVPAAAVIPAPIAYINIAAVKKLVVGCVVCVVVMPSGDNGYYADHTSGECYFP
jgi:hypothetical protein